MKMNTKKTIVALPLVAGLLALNHGLFLSGSRHIAQVKDAPKVIATYDADFNLFNVSDEDNEATGIEVERSVTIYRGAKGISTRIKIPFHPALDCNIGIKKVDYNNPEVIVEGDNLVVVAGPEQNVKCEINPNYRDAKKVGVEALDLHVSYEVLHTEIDWKTINDNRHGKIADAKKAIEEGKYEDKTIATIDALKQMEKVGFSSRDSETKEEKRLGRKDVEVKPNGLPVTFLVGKNDYFKVESVDGSIGYNKGKGINFKEIGRQLKNLVSKNKTPKPEPVATSTSYGTDGSAQKLRPGKQLKLPEPKANPYALICALKGPSGTTIQAVYDGQNEAVTGKSGRVECVVNALPNDSKASGSFTLHVLHISGKNALEALDTLDGAEAEAKAKLEADKDSSDTLVVERNLSGLQLSNSKKSEDYKANRLAAAMLPSAAAKMSEDALNEAADAKSALKASIENEEIQKFFPMEDILSGTNTVLRATFTPVPFDIVDEDDKGNEILEKTVTDLLVTEAEEKYKNKKGEDFSLYLLDSQGEAIEGQRIQIDQIWDDTLAEQGTSLEVCPYYKKNFTSLLVDTLRVQTLGYAGQEDAAKAKMQRKVSDFVKLLKKKGQAFAAQEYVCKKPGVMANEAVKRGSKYTFMAKATRIRTNDLRSSNNNKAYVTLTPVKVSAVYEGVNTKLRAAKSMNQATINKMNAALGSDRSLPFFEITKNRDLAAKMRINSPAKEDRNGDLFCYTTNTLFVGEFKAELFTKCGKWMDRK